MANRGWLRGGQWLLAALVALARRYSDLGQVSEWIYRNLCVSMSRNGYRPT